MTIIFDKSIQRDSKVKGSRQLADGASRKLHNPDRVARGLCNPVRSDFVQCAKVRFEEGKTYEELGKLVVAMDSKNNVMVVHPAADLLLAICDTPQTPQSLRDVLFKQVLHVPIDDPYLGLADALVPGSLIGR